MERGVTLIERNTGLIATPVPSHQLCGERVGVRVFSNSNQPSVSRPGAFSFPSRDRASTISDIAGCRPIYGQNCCIIGKTGRVEAVSNTRGIAVRIQRCRGTRDNTLTSKQRHSYWRRRSISLTTFGHRDFVADFVKAHFIHERANQEEAASAAFSQIGRISRVAQLGGIEAMPLIANHKVGRITGNAGDDEYSPITIGLGSSGEPGRSV